jgi:hypothetical protein
LVDGSFLAFQRDRKLHRLQHWRDHLGLRGQQHGALTIRYSTAWPTRSASVNLGIQRLTATAPMLTLHRRAKSRLEGINNGHREDELDKGPQQAQALPAARADDR